MSMLYTRAFSTNPPPSEKPRVLRRSKEDEDEYARKWAKGVVRWAIAFVLVVIGFSYLSVPLYRVFCQVTGFGGRTTGDERSERKTSRIQIHEDAEKAIQEKAKKEKEPQVLTVYFRSNTNNDLDWSFVPTQDAVKVRVGESVLAFFTARNLSSTPSTGVATYNITPMKAGIYFNKVQCFCFDEQRLQGGETVDMPVFFFVDPAFTEDERMMDVTDITLSYTFFQSESDQMALEEQGAIDAAERLQKKAAQAAQAALPGPVTLPTPSLPALTSTAVSQSPPAPAAVASSTPSAPSNSATPAVSSPSTTPLPVPVSASASVPSAPATAAPAAASIPRVDGNSTTASVTATSAQ